MPGAPRRLQRPAGDRRGLAASRLRLHFNLRPATLPTEFNYEYMNKHSFFLYTPTSLGYVSSVSGETVIE